MERYRQRDGSDVGQAIGTTRSAPRRFRMQRPQLSPGWHRGRLGGWIVALLVVVGVLVPVGPLATSRAAGPPRRSTSGRSSRSTPRPPGPGQRRAGRPVGARPTRSPSSHGRGAERRRPGLWPATSPPRASCRTRPPPAAGTPTPSQMCVIAANSGTTGNGYWPGDGSDGMEAAYMASARHRQNLLGAGYDWWASASPAAAARPSPSNSSATSTATSVGRCPSGRPERLRGRPGALGTFGGRFRPV